MASGTKVRTVKGVTMPKLKDLKSSSQEGFWAAQDPFGAKSAVRQLANTLHKGGRKRKPLPGSKLQPLFKNHTAPPRMENQLSNSKVLPSIGGFSDQETLIKHVTSGNTMNLPDLQPNTVRIFLSSNEEDMSEERAMLMKRAVPQIQEFCSEYGLHFQMVDLHWGVDSNMVARDFNVRNIHQREIADCQRTSLGPYFVALLGDKYGSQQLISEIPEEEFDTFHEFAAETDAESLLSQYYLKDTNAVPVSYRLQTIEEPVVVNKLISTIQECAIKAYENDKISLPRKRYYLMSTLEEDIIQGIIETKDPRRHCLCYRREFQNIREYLDSPGLANFFEIKQKNGKCELVEENYQASLRLADEVSQHLGVGNFRPYYIPWIEEGIKTSDQEFQNYLARLCNDFTNDMKDLIKQHAEKLLKGSKQLEKNVFREAMYHAVSGKRRITHFQGQSNVLFRMESFFRDPRQNNKPFLIYGEPGSGKSTLMAKVAKECKKWFTDDCVVVYRCLGSSTNCSSIYTTAMNITLQICMAYNLPLPDVNTAFSTLHKTLVTFRETLNTVSVEHAFIRPLFIVLDGIHELQPHEESLRAMWAIRDLPTNVHMVISSVSEIGSIDLLNPLIQLVTDKDAVMEVEKLNETEAKQIIKEMCQSSKRTLTAIQERDILEAYATSQNALHLIVMIEHALDWTSYSKPSECQAKSTPAEYMSKVLDELEEEYGPMLTMAFSAYITTSPIGVQERELIDLLMCDQDAEEDLEKFPGAINNGLMVFPSYLMAQFKFKLRNFLTDKMVCGKKAMAWKHKLFYAAAGEKYQVIFPGINEHEITEDATSYTLMLHENMANMYLTENRLQTMSVVNPKDNKKSKAIPLTNPQPVNTSNLLKLQRVPTHLRVMAPVEGLSRAKEAILFNFNWMQTKIKAKPLFVCMQDILGLYNINRHLHEQHKGLTMDDTQDMEILFEFLQLAEKALMKNPEHLASEILGRLGSYTDFEYLDKLLKGTSSDLEHTSDKKILPLYTCFTPPEQLLRYTMEGPTHFLGYLEGRKAIVMFSQKYGTDIWSIGTGELVHRFSVNPEQRIGKVIPGHKSEFVIIAHYSHLNHQTDLRVISTETGVDLICARFPQNFEAIALNQADTTIVVAANLLVEEVETKCLIGVSVHTKEILYTLPQEDIHNEGVTQLLFVTMDKEDDCLLTIGSKRSKDLGFWNLEKEEMVYKLDLHCFVDKVMVPKTTAICASAREGVLLFIDLNNGSILKRIEDTELIGLTDMTVSEAGTYVLIATRHNGVNIYDTQSYTMTKTLADDRSNQHTSPSKICLDPSESFVFVGYDTGVICVYLILTGQEVLRITGHKSKINSLNVSEDMRMFSSGQDDITNMWNLENYLLNIVEQLPESLIDKCVAQTHYSTEEGEIEFKKKEDDTSYPGKNEQITSFTMTSDGQSVITASLDGPIKVWNTQTGKLEKTLSQGCENGAVEVYLAYKDSLLIAHCIETGVPSAYRLQVWSMKSFNPVKFTESDTVLLYSACLFRSGDKLLTVSPVSENNAGMMFEIYDLFEMKRVSELKCNIFGNMNNTNLKFIGMSKNIPKKKNKQAESVESSDEATVKSARSRESARSLESQDCEEDSNNNMYAILDYFPEDNVSFFFSIVLSGKDNVDITMGDTDPIELDSVSPKCTVQLKDGNCITGTVEGELVVWNVATQKTVTAFHDQTMVVSRDRGDRRLSMRRAHDGPITCVVTSADSKVLLSGDTNGTIKVWNMTRKLLHTLEGHNSQINTLWLGFDKEIILSGSEGEEMLAYSVQTGELLTSFYAHSQVTQVAVTSDKSRCVAVVNRFNPRLLILKTKNM